MTRYFLDTEFNEFGGDLISLALVCEDGQRELYVSTPCERPGAWVKENVIPILKCPGADPIEVEPDQIGHAIAMFLHDDKMPTIISDWPDDIRYFCQAVITGPGEMVNIPRLQFQMLRMDAYPTDLPGAVQHNALWDARALRHVFFPAVVSGAKEP
ncbi:hypothetical protein ABIF07_001028 [Bradyrhizobium elkanii]|uniref:hypothetical protein n=1 Tax=Bradyrhizobium elkanii TaxID=29448 RepID=UPI0021683F06|nr:hypothetical protein [Bradyrhizobium elkanii]MCS3692056.1 hypothetical protein [Bradyrhizobium elkanii]